MNNTLFDTTIDLIYKNNNSYDGLAHIAVKSKRGLTKIASVKTSDISRFFSNLSLHKSCDYYITANTTSKDKRVSEALFSLNNIVIDIDCHSEELDGYDRHVILQDFARRMDELDILQPNIIHYTGRGLQLWWHIESCSAKLLFLYREAKQRIINSLDKFLKELQDEYPDFNYLKLDKTSSNNAVGYYRLFGSHNTATGHKTTYEIIHTNSHNINELLQLLPEDPEAKKNKKQFSNKSHWADKTYLSLNHRRMDILDWLIDYRDAQIGEETRDIILFLAYNAASQYLTSDMAKATVMKLNKKFKQPLNDLEYIFKYIDKKGLLRFKNETFYEWIDMDQNDIDEYTKTHPSKSNFYRDFVRRTKKKERNDKIMQLRSAGQTMIEIASTVSVCRQTVSKVIKNSLKWNSIVTRCKAIIQSRKKRKDISKEIDYVTNDDTIIYNQPVIPTQYPLIT